MARPKKKVLTKPKSKKACAKKLKKVQQKGKGKGKGWFGSKNESNTTNNNSKTQEGSDDIIVDLSKWKKFKKKVYQGV